MERVSLLRGKKSWSFKRKWLPIIIVATIFLIPAAIICTITDWRTLEDELKGFGYVPSNEIAQISDELKLTRKGKAIFYATKPQLQTSSAFNQTCGNDGQDSYTLGCYYKDYHNQEHIYLYDNDIESIDENGFHFDFTTRRAVTALHELMHAVYARKSTEEKLQICADTKAVANTIPQLSSELARYPEEQYCTESFARIGAEYIASLEESSPAKNRLAYVYGDYFTPNKTLGDKHANNQEQLAKLEAAVENSTNYLNGEKSRIDDLINNYYRSPSRARYAETNRAITNYNNSLTNHNSLVATYNKIGQALDSESSNFTTISDIIKP